MTVKVGSIRERAEFVGGAGGKWSGMSPADIPPLNRGNAAMNARTELAVTLSDDLYDHLCDEARRLGIPLEWLVASLVVDTIEETEPESALAVAG